MQLPMRKSEHGVEDVLKKLLDLRGGEHEQVLRFRYIETIKTSNESF